MKAMATKAAAAAATAAGTTGGRAVAQIDFFYDIASPYSWLAFETLLRYRSVWDAKISLRPFFLGGVMSETGNKPPATLKAKRLYMMGDLNRMARFHGVPLVPLKDKNAMYNTLAAQRLLTAVSMDAPEQLESVTRAMWMRLWGGQGDIATLQGLQEGCVSAGLEADAVETLMRRADSEDIKGRLKEVTNEALKRGAFGAPWITVKKATSTNDDSVEAKENERWHSFWGCDRFDVMAMTLGQPWLGPHPPSATSATSSSSVFSGPPPLAPMSQL